MQLPTDDIENNMKRLKLMKYLGVHFQSACWFLKNLFYTNVLN
jgi:hypothetical protein